MIGKDKITLKKIAKEAGVSVATVSRSLRHDRRINSGTRTEVLRHAIRLNYQGVSRKGVKRKNDPLCVGILLLPHAISMGHDVTLQYLRGITAQADIANCTVQMEELREKNFGNLKSEGDLPKMVKNRSVDVVIAVGFHYARDIEFIHKHIPVVGVMRRYKGADTVGCCDDEGVSSLVKYLAESGHKRLAWCREFCFHGVNERFYQMREAGFILGCSENGIWFDAKLFLDALWDNPDHSIFQKKLVKNIEAGVTGIVCANDRVAQVVAFELGEMKLRVPEDVNLVGFDALSDRINGKILTSYDVNFIEIGRNAVRVALQRVSEPVAPPIVQLKYGSVRVGGTTCSVR